MISVVVGAVGLVVGVVQLMLAVIQIHKSRKIAASLPQLPAIHLKNWQKAG